MVELTVFELSVLSNEFQLDPMVENFIFDNQEGKIFNNVLRNYIALMLEVHNVGSVKYCNKTPKKKSASVIDPMGFLVDFVSLIIFVNLICNTKPYYSLSFAVSK